MSLPDTVATHRFSSKLDSIDETDPCRSMASELIQKEEENPNIMVYKKMEALLEMMQDPMSGIVVKTVKSFISKIPSVFTGSDLIAWILKNLDVDDTGEALHLANLLGTYGYVFPIDDHVLSVKNDGTYYRFQTPCFWPSKCSEPENTDYAVYLCKRTMQNKQRLELVDYEAENLARLQKMFSRKWEFIFIQAEAQAKVDKKRDKLERKVLDSQERAFWDVHRPAPGCVNTTEVDIKKTCRSVKKYKFVGKTLNCSFEITEERLATIDCLEKEVDRLRKMVERRRVKISKVAESYLTYYEQYSELDPFTGPIEPSNPWTSDNIDYWEQENFMKDIPQRRVKRWGFSVRELLKDNCGKEHFRKFLEKEFSAENLKFWEACQRLRGISQRLVPETVQEIYTEYLSPSAHDPVNVDCKVAETVRKKVEQSPDRYCFEEAEEHIYQLMKNDCYNRYLRSDMYKEFLGGTKKKSTRSIIPKLPSLSIGSSTYSGLAGGTTTNSSKKGFATEVRRFRDLTKTQGFVNLMHQQQQQQGSSPKTTMQQVVQAIREASNLGKLQQMPNSTSTTTSSAVSTSTVTVATTSSAGTNSTNSTTITITTRSSVLTASNAKISITSSPSFQPNPTIASIGSIKEGKSGSFADLSSHLRSALSSPKNSRNVKDIECSSVDGAIGTSRSLVHKGRSNDSGDTYSRVIKKSLSVLQVVRGSRMTVDLGKPKSEVQKQVEKVIADNTAPQQKTK